MKDHIALRVEQIAECYINTGLTIRGIAKLYGVSKSTVHKDLTERIKEVRPELQLQVSNILKYHKDIRHINGGIATKKKFEKIQSEKKEEFRESLKQLEG